MSRLYVSRTRVRKKRIIFTPGLGYTPVMVEEKAVLSEETVNMLREVLGTCDILREIYIIAPDREYLELLTKSEFRVVENEEHPLAAPIMKAIYGSPIPNKYVVRFCSLIASYPPLGYYNSEKREIYILKSVSEKLGIIVHEEVHHALNTHNYSKLKSFEEHVARFYELCTEMNARPPTLEELDKLLGDQQVLNRLRELLNKVNPSLLRRHSASEMKKINPFINAITLVENGEIEVSILVDILKCNLCIEDYGLIYRFVKCKNVKQCM